MGNDNPLLGSNSPKCLTSGLGRPPEMFKRVCASGGLDIYSLREFRILLLSGGLSPDDCLKAGIYISFNPYRTSFSGIPEGSGNTR